MFYGIRENEFILKRELAGHPISNLIGCGLEEVPVEPFSATTYIKTEKQIL